MKGIVNISIAGITFKLDDEAYALLDNYLKKIQAGYGNSAEGAEIMNDIEARIAEIILTQQDAAIIVPRSLIESTLVRLGSPEDISEGAAAEAGQERKTEAASPNERRIPHRLYRNPDGAKFGGVCNGLATYFDVDAVLVRLLFAAPLVLMIFFFIIGWGSWGRMMTGFMTTAFILYFLLWIVIPKAKTPLQKLEMKGEPITKSRIEQTFREEFQSRSNTPQNIEMRAKNEKNASVFAEFISIVGKILLFCAKALVAVIGFSFIIAIVAIIVALFFVLFEGPAVVSGFTATSSALLAVLILLAVMIPLGLAVYGILKMLFGFQHNKPLVTTLMVVWLLTLVFGTVIVIKDIDNINIREGFYISRVNRADRKWDERTKREVIRIEEDTQKWHTTNVPLTIAGDTLHVISTDSLIGQDRFTLKIRNGSPEYTQPTLVIRKMYDGYKNPEDNDNAIDQLIIEPTIQNDTLRLKILIRELSGLRNARAEADLCLPEKREVVVANGINYNEYYNR